MGKRRKGSTERSADDLDQKIGDEVRERRRSAGVTQEELGEAIGVSFQQIQKYENGTNRLSASRLHRVASALSVPVSHFYADGVSSNGSDGARNDVVEISLDARVTRALARVEDQELRQMLVAFVESMASWLSKSRAIAGR